MSEPIAVPHEAIIRALHDRYGRQLAQANQEAAEASAALETLTQQRDEAVRLYNQTTRQNGDLAQENSRLYGEIERRDQADKIPPGPRGK